jgi:hypothetical protein
VLVDGKAVGQTAGQPELTQAGGTAVLELASPPRNFTVVVTGGTSEGVPVRGALRADVRGYAGGARTVYVNPVTTVIAAKVRRGYGPVAARRLVKCQLGLPARLDTGADLRGSDRWFGGDAFQNAAARGVAPVGGLTRRGAAARRFRDPRAKSAIALAPILAYLKEPALNLLKDVAVKKGKQLVARVLAKTGLVSEDVFDSDDIKEIRARFDAVDQKLVELKGLVEGLSVALNGTAFSQLVATTNDTLANISQATESLAFLAKMDPNDTTKAALARQRLKFIEDNLQAAPRKLDVALGGGSSPLADNILIAASRFVASRTRFFGAEESAKIEAVYDYYALAQARAALALTFYWEANPGTFSDTTIEAEQTKILRAVETQKKNFVKPAVGGE